MFMIVNCWDGYLECIMWYDWGFLCIRGVIKYVWISVVFMFRWIVMKFGIKGILNDL